MDNYRELIFRRNPNYITIWTFIIIILLIGFILLGGIYKYNQFKEFYGLVIEKESEKFVQILVPDNDLDIIKNDSLIIESKNISYSYEIDQSIYNENNKLYRLVNLKMDNIPKDDQIVRVIFKSQKTTFFNEIKNKIKKGMIWFGKTKKRWFKKN